MKIYTAGKSEPVEYIIHLCLYGPLLSSKCGHLEFIPFYVWVCAAPCLLCYLVYVFISCNCIFKVLPVWSNAQAKTGGGGQS